MRLFKRQMTDEKAKEIASYALAQMGFYSPEREVDITFVKDYMTRVVLDYDEVIAKVEKRSMVKGAAIMAGVLFVASKLTEDKEEEE